MNGIHGKKTTSTTGKPPGTSSTTTRRLARVGFQGPGNIEAWTAWVHDELRGACSAPRISRRLREWGLGVRDADHLVRHVAGRKENVFRRAAQESLFAWMLGAHLTVLLFWWTLEMRQIWGVFAIGICATVAIVCLSHFLYDQRRTRSFARLRESMWRDAGYSVAVARSVERR